MSTRELLASGYGLLQDIHYMQYKHSSQKKREKDANSKIGKKINMD